MKTYQVVITKHAIYEVSAENEESAEELAWFQYDAGHFSEPLCAEILEIEEIKEEKETKQ